MHTAHTAQEQSSLINLDKWKLHHKTMFNESCMWVELNKEGL